MTRYEKALRDYNGYQKGTIRWPKSGRNDRMPARLKLGNCICAVSWWNLGISHIATERHLAAKYGVPLSTMRMLIRLSQRGHTHISEFCAHIDTYENLTGLPLTEARALELLRALEGSEDAAQTS